MATGAYDLRTRSYASPCNLDSGKMKAPITRNWRWRLFKRQATGMPDRSLFEIFGDLLDLANVQNVTTVQRDGLPARQTLQLATGQKRFADL